MSTMADKQDREGLSLWYRIMYRIKYIGLSIFGPAQLGETEDPKSLLEQERAEKVAAHRALVGPKGGEDR
jgi:hypothetical protein